MAQILHKVSIDKCYKNVFKNLQNEKREIRSCQNANKIWKRRLKKTTLAIALVWSKISKLGRA
jgi:hypothetical protein